MRPPITRRLVVRTGACLGLLLLVWIPARGLPSLSRVGGAPTGPFAAQPTGGAPRPTVPLETPEPPHPAEPTPVAPAEPTPVAPDAPTPTGAATTIPATTTVTTPVVFTSTATPQPAPAPATARATAVWVPPTEPAASRSVSPVTTPASPTPSTTPSRAIERFRPDLAVDDLNEVCNTDRTGFSVRWSAVPGADHYTVRASGAGLSVTTTTDRLSQHFTCPTATGTVVFTVVARDSSGVRESEPGTVVRHYAEPLGGPGPAAPRAATPRVALSQP